MSFGETLFFLGKKAIHYLSYFELFPNFVNYYQGLVRASKLAHVSNYFSLGPASWSLIELF